MMRTIIISDIHGCYKAFNELLKYAGLDEDRDRLILNGDLFDRGPNSCEIYFKVRELQEEMGDRLCLIRGNHEQMMISAMLSGHSHYNDSCHLWLKNGGIQTIESFKEYGIEMMETARWIKDNSILYLDDQDYICCHAGIKEMPLQEIPDEIYLWDKDTLLQNTYTGKLAIVGHIPLKYPCYAYGNKKGFAVCEYGIEYSLPEKGIIGIDTGCAYDGTLTAMIIEDKKLIFKHIEKSFK